MSTELINPINPNYDQDDLYYDSKIIASIQSAKQNTCEPARVSVEFNSALGVVKGYLDRHGQIVYSEMKPSGVFNPNE